MRFLFLDIETGNFDDNQKKPHITEIGALVYDTKFMAPVEMTNMLICDGSEVTPEAEQYTGISTQMLAEHGISAELAKDAFIEILEKKNFDAIVAHNGVEFDYPKLASWSGVKLSSSPLIDTMFDVEFPENMKQKNLTYMQAFHGFVLPGHRAIFDCMALAKIFFMYDHMKAFERTKHPFVNVIAQTTFAQKELPRGLGFRWEPEMKKWLKTCRECDLQKFKDAGLNFTHTRLA